MMDNREPWLVAVQYSGRKTHVAAQRDAVRRIPKFHFALQIGHEAGDLPLDQSDLLIIFCGAGRHCRAETNGSQRECAGLLQLSAAEKCDIRASSSHFHEKALGFADIQFSAQGIHHGGKREAVFFRPVDDFHIQPGAHEQTVQERLSVAGLPHRTCGDRPVAHDPIGVHHLLKVPQGFTGRTDRFLAQVPLGESLPAELHSLFQRIQDAYRAISVNFGNIHTDRARSDIDGCH